MKKTTLALIFSSLALSSAMAQATPMQPAFSQQQKHHSYLNSVSIGAGILGGASIDAVDQDGRNRSGVEFGAGVGFDISMDHQLSKKMAIEIRGSQNDAIFKTSTTTVSITAKGILPISSRTKLIGKVGAAYLNTQHKKDHFLETQQSTSSFAPEVGIGVGFDLTNHINTSLEYNAAITSSNYYNGEAMKQTGSLAMGLASLNVTYQF